MGPVKVQLVTNVSGCETLSALLSFTTSTNVSSSWSPTADKAINHLKLGIHENTNLPATTPEDQVIVEVHAMNVGLGAIFSQTSACVHKIHSCKSTGDRKLLVVHCGNGRVGSMDRSSSQSLVDSKHWPA